MDGPEEDVFVMVTEFSWVFPKRANVSSES